MVYQLETAPTELVVSLDNAKAQLNIPPAFTGDDTLLTGMINAAALYVEKIIQGPVMTQTWKALHTDFTQVIELYKTPVSAITHVKYWPADGGAQVTVDATNYKNDLASVPARILFNADYVFADVDDRWDAVEVQFVAGYANEAAVPADLKQWILILITRFYEKRDYSEVDAQTDRMIKEALMAHAAWL